MAVAKKPVAVAAPAEKAEAKAASAAEVKAEVRVGSGSKQQMRFLQLTSVLHQSPMHRVTTCSHLSGQNLFPIICEIFIQCLI